MIIVGNKQTKQTEEQKDKDFNERLKRLNEKEGNK